MNNHNSELENEKGNSEKGKSEQLQFWTGRDEKGLFLKGKSEKELFWKGCIWKKDNSEKDKSE